VCVNKRVESSELRRDVIVKVRVRVIFVEDVGLVELQVVIVDQ
jgi:hypothetical protein